MGALFLDNFKPNICITTAAASTGIDKATLEMVIRMGIPRDIVTSFQERGRNARQPGMTGVYAITTDLLMYVKLLLSIIMPLSAPDETTEYRQVNSTISTFTSPQKLANSPDILNALFICHARQTLRLITINEAHLYAQHGSTFHDDLRVLG